MKQHFLPCLLLFLTSVSISSCIGDEPANAECDIENAWIHVDNPRSIFYNVYDSLVSVPSIEKEITFETRGDAIHKAPIFFTITPGATIYHVEDNGLENVFSHGGIIDFSESKIIKFRVRSEDRHYYRDYTVQVTPRPEMPVNPVFSFENNFELTTLRDNDAFPFYTWTETSAKIKWWASGNAGFRLAGMKAQATDFPTCPEIGTGIDGGNCLKLTTRDTGSLGKMVGMPFAAGNLFSGSFDTGQALQNTLASTRMGLPYGHKPSRLIGYYKYKPGAEMKTREGKIMEGVTDSPDIYCVVYRNVDDNGDPIQLDGANILSSPAIVGIARIKKEDVDISGTQWLQFDLPVVYTKSVDEADIFDYKYNTAVVFSSSLNGADFEGADGSTLWIDNVKLECEY